MTASERSYLDHNATVPLRSEVAEAMLRAGALCGNPSSVHAEGRAARAAIETARAQVAGLVGADPRHLFFTSGGTEAANTVLSPGIARDGVAPRRLLFGATEHACIRQGHGFAADAAEAAPVDHDGIVDLDWLAGRLAREEPGSCLVSVHAANNETGIVQPLAAVSALAGRHRALVHSDAVQAAGRIPLDMHAVGVDALTFSAHKLGGPKGVGAAALGPRVELGPRLVRGGGQERGQRAGTENVAAIVGFGVACEIAARERATETVRLLALRNRFEAAIARIAPEAIVLGARAERLPNTIAFAVPGLRAETAIIAFDLAGIAVSSGSACSSGKVARSHVLDAMGVPSDLAEGAIRLSLGWNSAEADLLRFRDAFERIVSTLYIRRRAEAA